MGRSQQIPRAGPPVGPRGDDTGCGILHVDMDAFYASVELRERPDLRGRPVIVGATGGRGVVLSATYEARAFGVRSAMPMTRARALCPQAVILPPRFPAYSSSSRAVMEIFRSITPLVQPLSLDEAFLDVTGAVRRLGSPAAIGELIRRRVHEEQRITCSVGVAVTKFVAKVASTRCKPDGLLVVPRDKVLEFLHPLPVSALWGVGERTEAQLRRLGIRTVGDIAHFPRQSLRRALGDGAGAHLHALAWGRDERSVVPHEPEKSIGAEETFAADVDDPRVVHRELLRLAERTAARLRSSGMRARTVSIKVRFADFRTITRSRTLDVPTDVSRDVYETAKELFDGLGVSGARFRLVGVRAEGLRPAGASAEQLLLGGRERGWREADLAVDQAVARFGSGALKRAALVRRGTPDREAEGSSSPAFPAGEPTVD